LIDFLSVFLQKIKIFMYILLILLSFALVNGCSSYKQNVDIMTEELQTLQNTETNLASPTEAVAVPTSTVLPAPTVVRHEGPRGYQTTPAELQVIADKANMGIEPYASAVTDVMAWAEKPWVFNLRTVETCEDANSPRWNDNSGGTEILYAKALAYHLTGNEDFADEVKAILEQIMTSVESITLDVMRCELTFGWGTPELVASADLIESVFIDSECQGPVSTIYNQNELGFGNCKALFQNWLVKNPYYVVSLSAEESMSNWGAAGTTTLAFIADYLWDRPEVEVVHRVPVERYGIEHIVFTPAEAYTHANQLALDRMNGYRAEIRSSYACDYFRQPQQNPNWVFVKSQISEKGIIPEDARREQYCNIQVYNGEYQNYPQIHLGNNIQQCELMLRRGDSSCYDNVDWTDLPAYEFIGTDGESKVTHLYPGRGSIERAIKAIIVDSGTEWRHDSALELAYRYYYSSITLDGFEQWYPQLSQQSHDCSQDVCYGTLTHGFSIYETPASPPTVPPP
jgi:hypothetical protein